MFQIDSTVFMITPTIKVPLSIKVPLLLVGAYVFISMMFIAQDVILPLIYAIIIAILLSPLVSFLTSKKINRILSIAIVLFVTLLVVLGLVTFLASRASILVDAFPQLADKLGDMLEQAINWASENFNVRKRNINEWITDSKAGMLSNSNTAIGTTLSTVGGALSVVFLTPVYVFMILLYKPHLVQFVYRLFGKGNNAKVNEMITNINGIIKSYLVGIFLEFIIIAVMNSVGLLLLGIQYAILLGIVGSLLNIIPYLGGIIAVAIYMIVALVTKTPIYILYVAILYAVIQFIDNNYIVPKIVGSKVQLNALVSILAVIAGGALWGIPGMFLSIPLTAIIKLIFDNIEPMKPWGFLLSDPEAESPPIGSRIKKAIAIKPKAKHK